MAQNYLSILASSAALEGFFAQISDVANPRKRNRLTKKRINEFACLKSWNNILLTVNYDDDDNSDQSEDSDFPASIPDEAILLESSSESD